MEKSVMTYVKSKERLLRQFKCPDDYFIRHLEGLPWTITQDSGIYFLSYWQDGVKTDAVIVKKNDLPLIYETKSSTMVIAIDCVKIAFVLSKDHRK